MTSAGLVEVQLEGYSYNLGLTTPRIETERLRSSANILLRTWNSINLNDSNAMVRFKKKLQALKKAAYLLDDEIRRAIGYCGENKSSGLRTVLPLNFFPQISEYRGPDLA
ncbi:hypothetical protein Tco_0168077 [Tanacetum coccineum]